MASSLSLTVLFLAAIATQCLAQKAAPGPAPSKDVNLTAILEKGGQFTTWMRLLGSTQVGNQIANQVNTSTEGMTIFAPTDNAFQNLKAGTLNDLTTQQQVQLVLYHVLPKYYSFEQFETASNPIRTQASGQDGEPFGLNIISLGNQQINVSSGVVTTTVNNALRQQFPLAVYQVDKVLLPEELFGDKPKAKAKASAPVSSPKGGKAAPSEADGPAADDDKKNGGNTVKSVGLGVIGVVLVTMGLLS